MLFELTPYSVKSVALTVYHMLFDLSNTFCINYYYLTVQYIVTYAVLFLFFFLKYGTRSNLPIAIRTEIRLIESVSRASHAPKLML